MDIVGLVTNPLSNTIVIFVGVVAVVFALISIFIGIWVATRFEGKLKSAMTFLILAIVVMLAKETMLLAGITVTNLIVGSMRILIVLLILFAMLNMRQMIDGIDGHLGKREVAVGKREVVVRGREKALRKK